MNLYYAGIGSRSINTTSWIACRKLARTLAERDWTLRSGGADGSDTAFENGCDLVPGTKEIYLPWKGFNDNPSPLYDIPDQAFEIAKNYHPTLRKMRDGAIHKLMARNSQQVLGMDLRTPVKFIACWTDDGVDDGEYTTQKTGGTGQAIRIATAYDIPVFNLKNRDAWNDVMNLVFDYEQKEI